MRKIIFGIRKSRLAESQLNEFLAYLANNKLNLDYSVKTITVEADKDKVSPACKMGQGIFTKEIERALIQKDIDCAVHSLKDMPVKIEPGTILSCFPVRQDVRDCMVARDGVSRDKLKGLKIGTGSPRRSAFLKEMEQDIEVLPLRGNVDTRLRKMDSGDYDAMVLAVCGLKRLGYINRINRYFDPDIFVPAAGQGIICSQTRNDDNVLNNSLRACSYQDTEQSALLERKVLEALDIGCLKPFGVYARFNGNEFIITAKSYQETSHIYIYEQRKSPRIDSEKVTFDLISFMKQKMKC